MPWLTLLPCSRLTGKTKSGKNSLCVNEYMYFKKLSSDKLSCRVRKLFKGCSQGGYDISNFRPQEYPCTCNE